MTCGVAGSGKTTFARSLEAEGFVRLSVDETLWERFGRYGIDYPAERYSELSQAAEDQVRSRLLALLADGRDVVLDLSFWERSAREAYKALIAEAGGEWRLVHLQVDPDVLRTRLAGRAETVDANGAFPVTDGLLERYLDGFEVPDGEGEEVILP